VNTDSTFQRYGSSSAALLLQDRLANSALKKLKFRPKYAIGPFVFDLVCPDLALVVEIDGERPGRSMAYDWERAQYLQRRGYRVLRIWGPDIQKNPTAVLGSIAREAGVAAGPAALEPLVA
jgi:very-short-patch-repair endonuclease